MPPTVRLDVPADPSYFRLVMACVAELVALEPTLDEQSTVSHDLQLAVQELCVNISTHAYAGRADARLRLELGVHDRTFEAEFRDNGITFDPSGVKLPNLDEGQVHGYGVFLIRQLVDEMSYSSEAGENRWRLVKRLA